MIVNSKDGKIQYSPSDDLVQLFEDIVKRPFNEHPITEPWQRLVIDSYTHNNFESIKNIVGRGQANFDETFDGLTPDERVLVYCYDNMQQHVVSQLYIFEKHTDLFDKYLFKVNNKVLFIDFGCGPLSSGIALARYYAESIKSNGQSLKFNYIGIDQAESMLRKAREFSLYPGLFHNESTFNFFNPYAQPPSPFTKKPSSYLDNCISENILIIFNFSYFFASPTLDEASLKNIINFIKNICNKCDSSQQVYLFFQNPQVYGNSNWDKFTQECSNFTSAINGSISETFNYFDTLSKRPRNTKLYYDILSMK